MAAATEPRATLADRVVDVATVVLISLAAVGTAWCSYQSARWDALQTLSYSKANAARIEASSLHDRANARRIVDVILFTDYVAAFNRDRPFSAFLAQRFTPELKVAVKAWEATNPLRNPRAPKTPFAMSDYKLRDDAAARDATLRADSLLEDGVRSNEVADRYLFLTVLYASSSFLGGIALKLRSPNHLITTVLGFAMFIVGLTLMLHYPIR